MSMSMGMLGFGGNGKTCLIWLFDSAVLITQVCTPGAPYREENVLLLFKRGPRTASLHQTECGPAGSFETLDNRERANTVRLVYHRHILMQQFFSYTHCWRCFSDTSDAVLTRLRQTARAHAHASNAACVAYLLRAARCM